LGHVHRLLRDLDRVVDGQRDTGREAPGSVEDDADGQAEVLVVLGALQQAVAQRDRLRPDSLQPELGEGRTEVLGPLQGGLGESLTGQGEERRVDLGHGSTL
jgi:hypothetical protein